MITGAFDGGRDQYWFRVHLPTRRIGDVHRPQSSLCTLGVWGPTREATLARSPRASTPAPPTTLATPASRTARCTSCWSTASRARCSASPTSASSAGRSTPTSSTACACGTRLGRRAGVRDRAGRHRRVRRHGPDREGLSADGRRAGERVRPGRGRARASEGEVRRLHRQGAVPRRPREPRPTARPRCCARWR